jgi:hypothetical protein
MNATKYLLAKYIADLHRFEPRNIGVIVWSPTGIEARFLAEHPNRPGEVDGRSIPGFVTSSTAYKQWIRYWRDTLSGSSLKPLDGGAELSSSSPAFIEALQQSGRGNFVLVDAGVVLDFVGEEELPAVADQLFSELVETNAPEETRDLDLDAVCDQLLEQSHLINHKNFYTNYPVHCAVNGVEEDYVFSHAFANGTLQRLYQRLPLPKGKARLRKNVHDVAWSFEQVFKQRIVEPQNAGVLVYVTEEQEIQPDIDRSLKLLRSLTRVINLRDERTGQLEFEPLAKLPES